MHGKTTAPATCDIFDVQGRLVRSLVMVPTRDGLAAEWHGRTAIGTDASPGIYYASVNTGAKVLKRKIILVR